jgi:hypothetical protein
MAAIVTDSEKELNNLNGESVFCQESPLSLAKKSEKVV